MSNINNYSCHIDAYYSLYIDVYLFFVKKKTKTKLLQ